MDWPNSTAGISNGWRICGQCVFVLLMVSWVGCASAPPAGPPAAPAPTSAAVGETTLVAIQAPAAPPCSLDLGIGKALSGIAKGLGKIGRGIRNRLGMRFPGLEPKPALTSITDPSNMSPDADPAAQAAAEIKAAEDGAEQKIKALRYLARIGCAGCYPGVEEAFLSALEDCTERVRYEAVKALRAAGGDPCKCCAAESCCSEKLLKKLNQLGNERNEKGFVEPSARVRRSARIAVANCGGYNATVSAESELFPEEGPPPMAAEASEGSEGAQGAQGAPAALPAPAPAPAPAPGDQSATSTGRSVRRVDFRAVVPQSKVPVAKVNNDAVLESDLLLEYVMAHPDLPVPKGLAQLPKVWRDDAIERAIRRKLLAQEAQRRMSAEQLATLLSRAFPQGEIDSVEREEVLAEAWMRQIRPNPSSIGPADIQRRFEREFAVRTRPGQTRWEQISVRKSQFPNRNAAFETIEYARNRAMGIDGAAPQGFHPNQMEFVVRSSTTSQQLPAIHQQVLATLSPGALSPVVENGDHLIVFRLLERTKARPVTLEEVRTEVIASIRRTAGVQFDKMYVEQLRRNAEIWKSDR